MNTKVSVCTSLCVLSLIGCQPRKDVDAQPSVDESAPRRREIVGERLYEAYCAGCHGETGGGDGLHSFTLNPPPANHVDSALMSTLSDEYLFQLIINGGSSVGKSPEMPRWRDVLNKNQIENVILYIRTLPRKQTSTSSGQ